MNKSTDVLSFFNGKLRIENSTRKKNVDDLLSLLFFFRCHDETKLTVNETRMTVIAFYSSSFLYVVISHCSSFFFAFFYSSDYLDEDDVSSMK